MSDASQCMHRTNGGDRLRSSDYKKRTGKRTLRMKLERNLNNMVFPYTVYCTEIRRNITSKGARGEGEGEGGRA